MKKKLSYEQMEKLLHHVLGINSILAEVLTAAEKGDPFESETTAAENLGFFDDFPKDFGSVTETNKKPVLPDYAKLDLERKNYDLNRLCGRWRSDKRTIAITRAGDHFVLTYLKRNGTPSDERYILMWFDGDIIYYGYEDRMTSVAYNKDNGVLMISPGTDYTREPQEDKK